TINGFDTHEVIATVTVHEKGKKIEESGGMVMTADNWLTKTQTALKEIGDFDMRDWQKLESPALQIDAQQLAAVMAALPGIKEATTRYGKAGLDGTPIQVTMTFDGVKSAEQMQQQQQQAADNGGQKPPT